MPRVGRFELEEVIARGATATVLRGRDPQDGRPVAIKLFEAGRLASQAARERFETELRVLGRLRHPNLVSVLGSGQEGGAPFIAMELVEGIDLGARLLHAGPVPPREAAEGIRDVALALQYVHACGVLHRDVKPSNVLVDPDGRFLLGDFGLARDLAEERERLTRTGTMLGTPGFWAPEQAMGQLGAIDARTDVWGLGATLFAALTGSSPLPSESLSAWLDAHRRGEPCRFPAESQVPAELRAVCLACLERDPARRPASADEVARALTRWLRSVGQKGARGTRLAWVVAPACLLAAGAATAASLILGASGSGARPPSTADPAKVTTRAADPSQLLAEAAQLRAAGQARPALDLLDRALALAPERADLLLLRGVLRVEVGERAAAEADLRRAAERSPGAARPRALLASCLLALEGRRADAEAELALAREQDPGSAEVLLVEAELVFSHLERDGLLAGKRGAERAVEADPTLAHAHQLLGVSRFWLGEVEEAMRDLDRALELAPCRWEAWHMRGFFHFRLGDDPRAVADLTRSLELTPNAESRFYRGWSLFRLGWSDRAVADLTAALEEGAAAARTRAILAQARLAQRRFDEASDDAGRALELLGPGVEAWVRPAAEGVQAAVRLERDGASPADPRLAFETRRFVAGLRFACGDLRAALVHVEAIIRENPGDVSALLNRVMCRAELGELEAAREEAERLAARGDALGLTGRGWFRLVVGEDADALADLEAAVRLEPAGAPQAIYRGLALALLGRVDEAAQVCSVPRTPEGFLARSLVRRSQGDAEGARADLAAAGAFLGPRGPDHPLVKRVAALLGR